MGRVADSGREDDPSCAVSAIAKVGVKDNAEENMNENRIKMRIDVFGRSDEDIRNTCRQADFSPSCWIVLIMYGYGQCSFSGGNYPEMSDSLDFIKVSEVM